MSNLQSVLGGAVWMAVAAALMMMTFAPVAGEQKSPSAPQLVAQAPASHTAAA